MTSYGKHGESICALYGLDHAVIAAIAEQAMEVVGNAAAWRFINQALHNEKGQDRRMGTEAGWAFLKQMRRDQREAAKAAKATP